MLNYLRVVALALLVSPPAVDLFGKLLSCFAVRLGNSHLTINEGRHLCRNWCLADTSGRFQSTLSLAGTTHGGSRNQTSISKFAAVRMLSAVRGRDTARGNPDRCCNQIALIEGFERFDFATLAAIR
jgi:hypothetical protein